MTGPGEPTNMYAVKVWLECRQCEPREVVTESIEAYLLDGQALRKKVIRRPQFGTIKGFLEHCRDDHPVDVLTIEAVKVQTIRWKNEWLRANQPGPFMTYGTLRSNVAPGLDLTGITS